MNAEVDGAVAVKVLNLRLDEALHQQLLVEAKGSVRMRLSRSPSLRPESATSASAATRRTTRPLAAKSRQSESGACYAFPCGRWSAYSISRASANRREPPGVTPLIDFGRIEPVAGAEKLPGRVSRVHPAKRCV
jgi:hypothetical protein